MHARYLLAALGIATASLLAAPAAANPVSFKDGYGVMPTYSNDWSDLQLNYSVTNRYSVGASAMYRDGSEHRATYVLGQFNWLIKRWNELESQANVYVSTGAGGVHESHGDDSIAGYGALEADYETRRIYTLGSVERLEGPEDVDFTRLRYRAGFSPYEAPIDKLQTWLILQLDLMPEMDDELRVTPLLRLFYNNFAFEGGSSLEGAPYFGLMAHF